MRTLCSLGSNPSLFFLNSLCSSATPSESPEDLVSSPAPKLLAPGWFTLVQDPGPPTVRLPWAPPGHQARLPLAPAPRAPRVLCPSKLSPSPTLCLRSAPLWPVLLGGALSQCPLGRSWPSPGKLGPGGAAPGRMPPRTNTSEGRGHFSCAQLAKTFAVFSFGRFVGELPVQGSGRPAPRVFGHGSHGAASQAGGPPRPPRSVSFLPRVSVGASGLFCHL